MSHIGQGRKFLALYMQRLLLTKQTRFKAVRALLGPKRTISTWLVSEPIPDPGVGVCLAPQGVFVCLAPQSHGTQRGRCVCMGGVVFVMSHIGLLLTKQMRFKAVRVPLGPKRTISTWLSVGRYILCGPCARHLDFQFIRLFLSKFNFNCL